MSPQRIQLRRVKGWRKPVGAVYVGRPTKWGNPFRVGERVPADSPLFPYLADTVPGGARGLGDLVPLLPQMVADAYGWWLLEQPPLMLAATAELGGRDLACWCHLEQPCHADVLLELANGGTP